MIIIIIVIVIVMSVRVSAFEEGYDEKKKIRIYLSYYCVGNSTTKLFVSETILPMMSLISQ